MTNILKPTSAEIDAMTDQELKDNYDKCKDGEAYGAYVVHYRKELFLRSQDRQTASMLAYTKTMLELNETMNAYTKTMVSQNITMLGYTKTMLVCTKWVVGITVVSIILSMIGTTIAVKSAVHSIVPQLGNSSPAVPSRTPPKVSK